MTVLAKIWVDRYTQGGIVEKNDGGSDSGFTFEMNGAGGLRGMVLDSGSNKTWAYTYDGYIPTGKWVQVAMTWDGTQGPNANNLHFFVNGVDQQRWGINSGSGTVSYTNATNRPLRIGNSSIDLLGAFNGKIAYVAIYKGRILTGTEMQQLDGQLPVK